MAGRHTAGPRTAAMSAAQCPAPKRRWSQPSPSRNKPQARDPGRRPLCVPHTMCCGGVRAYWAHTCAGSHMCSRTRCTLRPSAIPFWMTGPWPSTPQRSTQCCPKQHGPPKAPAGGNPEPRPSRPFCHMAWSLGFPTCEVDPAARVCFLQGAMRTRIFVNLKAPDESQGSPAWGRFLSPTYPLWQ